MKNSTEGWKWVDEAEFSLGSFISAHTMDSFISANISNGYMEMNVNGEMNEVTNNDPNSESNNALCQGKLELIFNI